MKVALAQVAAGADGADGAGKSRGQKKQKNDYTHKSCVEDLHSHRARDRDSRADSDRRRL